MASTASRNKARGRAFQAKLAELSGGMNVGTLGGEDVMHEEFSYEAKTYDPNAKSHKGKDWVGEQILKYYEDRAGITAIVIAQVSTYDSGEPLVMMRWSVWSDLANLMKVAAQGRLHHVGVTKNKFKGRTYMRQAEANCPDGKIPIVVVHTMGRRHKTDVVLIYRIYWDSLLKNRLTKGFK